QDRPAQPLTLRLGPVDSRELFVVVEEGDNSSLPIASARVLLPAYRLRFYRDRDATLRLAYGQPDLTAPRYDLALLPPQLVAVTASEATAGGEQPGAAAAAAAAISPKLFWTALAVAVVALLAIIVRLLRTATPEETSAT